MKRQRPSEAGNASEGVAPIVVDFLGALYRNLLRDESDRDEVGSGGGPALLSVLRRAGGCTMTELSRHLRVSKPNITFLVDRLENDGFVVRERDPGDRRVTIIRLTTPGRARIEATRIRALNRVGKRLDLLSPEDRGYIEKAVPRVMSILAALYTDGGEERPAKERTT